MGDAAATAAADIQPTSYVISISLFRIMLEFFVLAFGVDVIGLSCIDVICSSTLLICMIGFTTICMIMIYKFIIRIKSYGLLLIFSTVCTYGRYLYGKAAAACLHGSYVRALACRQWLCCSAAACSRGRTLPQPPAATHGTRAQAAWGRK